MAKIYELPFGKREGSTPDPALEGLRQAQSDIERERLREQRELERKEHEKNMAKAEAEAKKAMREAQGEPLTDALLRKIIDKVDPTASEQQARQQMDELRKRVERTESENKNLQDQLYAKEVQRLSDRLDQLMVELKKKQEGEAGRRTADEIINEAVGVAEKLGYARSGGPEVPYDVQLQLKKMDMDLQLRLAEMKSESERRDREWELTLRKWDEEKDLKRQEMAQRAQAEKERMQFLTAAQERIGRIIARVTKEGGGGISGTLREAAEKSFHIEATEGEEGEATCPKCDADIFIAPDAKEVICSGCGLGIEVRRTAKPVKGKA
ncbi:MAG: hypothetical protein JRE40_02025 [Deltaproteobacteria bacterium]|nr:hypothetical protein [Deltaproteobacteria bacterium]